MLRGHLVGGGVAVVEGLVGLFQEVDDAGVTADRDVRRRVNAGGHLINPAHQLFVPEIAVALGRDDDLQVDGAVEGLVDPCGALAHGVVFRQPEQGVVGVVQMPDAGQRHHTNQARQRKHCPRSAHGEKRQ